MGYLMNQTTPVIKFSHLYGKIARENLLMNTMI